MVSGMTLRSAVRLLAAAASQLSPHVSVHHYAWKKNTLEHSSTNSWLHGRHFHGNVDFTELRSKVSMATGYISAQCELPGGGGGGRTRSFLPSQPFSTRMVFWSVLTHAKFR